MNISSQVGNIKYITTVGFNDLLDSELELAEEFMSNASKLINNKTDMAVSDINLTIRKYEDDDRTVRIPSQLPQKCYAIVNETGGITYMTAEEY